MDLKHQTECVLQVTFRSIFFVLAMEKYSKSNETKTAILLTLIDEEGI